jgi:hypothetical protein
MSHQLQIQCPNEYCDWGKDTRYPITDPLDDTRVVNYHFCQVCNGKGYVRFTKGDA